MTNELERRLAALPDGPPGPGRTVSPQGGGGPAYRLLDGTPAAGVWAAWAERFPATGLWPLLVRGLHGQPERPWASGEVGGPRRLPVPLPAADAVLRELWADGVLDDEEDEEDLGVLTPFGPTWPGTAPAGTLVGPPEQVAARVAHDVLHDRGVPALRPEPCGLALVAVDRGADVVDALGWQGAANYDVGPGAFAVVLRSWEERFAARVVGLGFDTLHLAVAAPPQDRAHARAVAAEHHALCSDNVLQGSGTLEEYAGEILGETYWSFWWD